MKMCHKLNTSPQHLNIYSHTVSIYNRAAHYLSLYRNLQVLIVWKYFAEFSGMNLIKTMDSPDTFNSVEIYNYYRKSKSMLRPNPKSILQFPCFRSSIFFKSSIFSLKLVPRRILVSQTILGIFSLNFHG